MAFIIGRAAARVKRNVPRRLIFSTASHCSSFIRSIMLSRVMPALLTRICSPPQFLTTSSTTSPTRCAVGDVAGEGSATPPAARMAATVSARVSALMSTQATLAPAAARVSAMARPRPRAAPVTMAGCPARSAEIRLFVVWLMVANLLVELGLESWVLSLSDGTHRRNTPRAAIEDPELTASS